MGCSVSVDLSGSGFECKTEPQVCPTGQICESGTCVFPGANPDAATAELGYTRQLTIPSVVSVETNVPVMIALDSSRIDYDVAGASGEKLFFQSAGQTLSHEIVEWNPAGTSRIWLLMPTVGQASAVTMTYGREPPAASANVWSSYGLVLHFEQDFANSAVPAQSLSIEGGADTGDGQFGKGAELDGIDDAIDLGTNSSLFNGAAGATVGAWVQMSDLGSYSVIEYSNNTPTSSRVLLNVLDGIPSVGVLTDEVAANTEQLLGPALETDRWYWLVGAIDLAASEMRLYIDGVKVSEQSLTISATEFPADNSALATIGRNETSSSGYFDGLIDEAQAAAFAASDAFVSIQFSSMSDGLFAFGPEQEILF